MNPTQYVKNVGKSMGYIAIDVFKNMNPAVAEFYSNAKSFSTDLYQTIDDFKGKAISNDSDSIKSKFKSTAVDAWKNARDDFLSGNWYNKERKEAAEHDMMKSMGFDLDFDMDFDLDDFGDDETMDSSSKVELEQEEKNTREVVGAVNGSVASAANTVAAATAKSTEYMVAIQTQNTTEMYNLNVKGFNNIGLGLNAINANLSTILSLAEPLTNHMQNAATYYTKSTEIQTQILNTLTDIANYMNPKRAGGARSTKKSIDDYVNDGGLNFAAIFSDMKESISSTIKEFKEMADMFGGGKSIKDGMIASPISSMLTFLLPMLMGKGINKNTKWFNDSLKSLGHHAYNKLADFSQESLIGSFLEMFGFSLPRNTINKKIATDKYEKGKVDWDGTSRKALMEVIPYYLSKMTAIMEGSNDIELFNYDTGKFETKKSVAQRFEKSKRDLASTYSYEFDAKVKKSSKKIDKKDLEEFNLILALDGGTNLYNLISTSKKTRDDYIKSLKNRSKEAKAFLDSAKGKQIIALINKATGTTNKEEFNKFDLEEVLMETGDLRSRLREEFNKNSETGEYNTLFRNEKGLTAGLMFGGKDSYEMTAVDYLRGIYQNTMRIGAVSVDGKTASFDPLGLNRKFHDNMEATIAQQKKAAKERAEAEKSGKRKYTKKEDKPFDQQMYQHYESKFSKDEWEEINKNNKYRDYLKNRYERELEGLEVDDDNPVWREINAIKYKTKLKGKITAFTDRFGLGEKLNDFFAAVTDNLKTPAALFDTMITTFRSTLHDIIFSDKGLFGWMFNKENGVLRKPIKKLLGFVDDRVGTEFTDWFGFNDSAAITDNLKNVVGGVQNAYNGRVVRRTGLAAVSEGEIIIPAELNPFYRKSINKAKQIRDENSAIRNFYGSFANGGAVGADNSKDNSLLGRAKGVIKKGFIDFGSLLYDSMSDVIGKKDKKSKEAEKKSVTDIIKGAVDDIKPHAADAMIGGIVGGGVSLLTGAVISPVLGASIGAATGLVMSSEKVRDFLFGKMELDENGNEKRKGGLFGDTGTKIRQFVEDQLPDTLLGGALGGAGGAILGHPVLGMFIGAGAGFISKSKGVQNFLFGEYDEKTGKKEGGLLSQELQDQIKKLVPGMSVGAITGLVSTAFGGPFGLIGNMLVGSVLGGIASTDSFKNFFFGEKGENGKREGGLIQVIRTNVLDPSREILFNMTERIRSDIRGLAVNFFDSLKNGIDRFFSSGVGLAIKNIFGSITDIGPLKGLKLKAKEFTGLQNLSNRITAGNIRRGINVRDKNGKLLSAKERLDLLKGTKFGSKDRYLNSTGYKTSQLLSRVKTESGLGRFNDFVNEVYAADKDTRLAMMSKKKYRTYFDRLGIDENVSKSDLMKMRDAIKVEEEARFNNPVTKGIDSSDAITNIKNDINAIKKHIVGDKNGKGKKKGKGKKSDGTAAGIIDDYMSETEEIDDSTNAGREKIKEKEKRNSFFDKFNKLFETTKKNNEESQEFREAVAGTDDSALNDKESKKGGLLNKLFGEASTIGKAAKSILTIGTAVAGIGLLVGSVTGMFDQLLSFLPGMGGSNGSTSSYTTKNGDNITFNWKDGFTTTDEDGNTVPVDAGDIDNTRTDTYSWSERVKEALARLGIGAALTVPVAMMKNADKLLEMSLKTLAKLLKRVPIIKGQGKLIDNFVKLLGNAGEEALRKAPEATVKSVCQGLEDFLAVVTIAMVVIDFTSGMQDAEVTFQVSNPTFAQRIISGYIRSLKNLIPVIGVLIPDAVIVDIAVKCFGGALGMDKLQQQRDEAEAELAQYNTENGTDLTWAQYQKGVLGNKTWTEEVWEGAKSKGASGIQAIKSFATNPGGYISNAFSAASEAASNKSGGIVSKGMEFNVALVDNLLPGIIGDILSSGYKVYQKAMEGDVSGMQSVNLAAFEGDNRGITSFVSHLFNPILATAKLGAYPIAFLVKFGKDLWESMTGVNKGMDSINKDIFTASTMVQGKALVGDLPGMWKLNVEGNTGIGFIDKIQAVLLTGLKVLDTPWAAVGFAIKSTVSFLDDQFKGIKKGYEYLDKQKEIAKSLLESNEENHSKVYQIDKPGDDVSMGGLFYAGAYVTRTFTIATELVKGVGRTLMSMFKDTSFYKTHTAMTQNNLEAARLAFAADPIGMWQLQDSNTETGFWSFLSKGSLILNKVMNTPWAVTSRLVVSLVEGLVEQGKKGIDTFGTIKTDSEALAGYAFSGDFENLFSYESTANPDGDSPFWGGLGSLAIGAERMVLAIPAGITWIGGKLGKKVDKIVDDVKTAADFFKSNIDKGSTIAQASVLTTGNWINWNALTSDLQPEDGSIMTGIFNGMTILTRMIGIVPAAIKLGGVMVKSVFDTYKTAFTNNSTAYDTAMADLTSVFNDDNQTFQNVWDVKLPQFDTNDPLADFRYAGFSISKLLLTGVKFIKGFFKSVIEEIDFTSIWQGIKDIANFKKDEGGAGSGIGAGSSFISQIDPRYAGKMIGGSTVGAMGCGPAAASMVLGNSMGANINLARRYQTYGGTDLSYFGDVFARNGRRPIYYNLSGGASGQDMISDIAAGKSVVLMGRDPYNRSKANSPFGPGNHYVVARGFRNGGIVIDDPESTRGGRIYSPSILNSVTAAVGAGSSGLRRRLTGIGAGGAMTSNPNAQAIWAFFKREGYADGAVAGILANIQAESSFNTRASGDNGTSYGICQWHLGRKTKLENFAASKGMAVDDINLQIAYLKSELDAGAAGGGYASINDPEKAAEQFCRQFERPDLANHPEWLVARKNNAVEFYNAFSGKTFSAPTGVSTGFSSNFGTKITPSTASSSDSSKPWANKTGAARFFSAASNLGSIFASAFSSIFSGNGGNDNAESAANQFKSGNTSSGTTNSSAQVTQWPGKQPVQYMTDMLGKLRYSNSQRDPDKGSGDCTSTVQWAIRKAGGPDISTHTGWQYANKNNWQQVLWYNNGQMLGNNPIPVNVQPNDLIYYRSKSNLDESVYPDSIGHVEMVLDGNTLIGNGSDPGTKTKGINWNKDRILKIVRVNNATWGGSGSGLDLSDLAPRGLKSSGAGRSGNLYSFSDYRSSRGGAGGSDKSMFLILRAMLTFVEALVDNTKDIKSIYTLLTKYCAGSLNKAEAAQALSEMSSSDSSKIEDGLASLKATIDSILAS